MRRVLDWLVALVVLALGRGRRPELGERRRALPEHRSARADEAVVAWLLIGSSAAAVAFVLLYALEPDTQLLGLALALSLSLVALACALASRRLVAQETQVEAVERVHPDAEEETARIVAEGVDGITRRRLLVVAAGAAGTALTAAAVVPAASLGPLFDTERLQRTPWRRGVRLVDERGRPIRERDVVEGAFLTAFPEGVPKERLDAPLIVIRLDPAMLELPAGRSGWAPEGILAFSKICPHAGCAVSMYRVPSHPGLDPGPALVCPCHYSTFDPVRGGALVFGPAGRSLPQLPLAVAADGRLVAAGPFRERVGPSWWGVRL
ncbi:MAG: Rieske 2Fe-2S domain-containing protein [Pseudomonadota bacterium]